MEAVERFLDLEAQVVDDDEEEIDDEDEMRRSPSLHNFVSRALTSILQVISLSTAIKGRKRKRANFSQWR